VTVGVIAHLDNPTPADVRALATGAEEAGADWLGLPDAFWWRDTWLLAGAAALVTERLVIGPVVTNPYLRHPFHTVAAVATLQDLAGPRVQLGLGAGGSETSAAARVERTDAAERIEALAFLVRSVADGEPLDPATGRTLEVPLARPPILVAGRAASVLTTAGRVADRALLWSVPSSDLARCAGIVYAGAAARPGPSGPEVELVWAPGVAHDERTRARLERSAPYAVLNSRPALRAAWGLDSTDIGTIRRLVVAGDATGAAARIPRRALDDLIVDDPDPGRLGAVARDLAVGGIAVPVFDVSAVATRVEWARAVLAAGRAPALSHTGPGRQVETTAAGARGPWGSS
jgi:5,10-methylenetetrahydromethanopterin reductase